MVQLFKVVSVGELKPVLKRVGNDLVELERLSNGENAVKRVIGLRSTYDYSIDQSGKVSYYQDYHYPELLGSRAEECMLMPGDLIMADLRGRRSEKDIEGLYLGKFIPVNVDEL